MRHRGFSQGAIIAALLMENEQRCNPPLTEEEVLGIADSITRYEPGVLLPSSAFPHRQETSERSSHYLTDLGNARRLVARHGQNLRFCHLWDQWFVWNGLLWVRDIDSAVMRRAKETVESMYDEAASLRGDQCKKLIEHAERSQAAPRLDAMIELATSEIPLPIRPDQFDTNPWLLTVQNGTLNLQTGTLQAPCRENYMTKQTPVCYDPEAHCPTWLAFLHRIMQENHELIAFLQKAVGYTLTGDTSEQVLFLLYGTGANGKSTFLEVLRDLLGGYAQQTDFTTFLARKSDKVRNDVARLCGARLVTAVEVESGQRLDEALVKQVTGGDTITARFLYQEFFEFTPQFKLFLAANHKPVIWGTDHAIWRRIRLIPFDVTIPPAERDKDLLAKLRAELSGILAWAVQGCLAWQREGLGVPKEIDFATESYREEMDPVGAFLEDCCVLDPQAKISTGTLYEAYMAWCNQSGESVMGRNAFSARLGERGFTKVRLSNSRGWAGLSLKAAWEPEAVLRERIRQQFLSK
jgi:putative DNA primase/helicase